MESGRTPLQYICAASALDNDEVTQLIAELDTRTAEPILLSDDLFEALSSVHASVGILITFSIDASATIPPKPADSCIILENVQDPGNLGTILRTAVATGASSVLLSADCTSPWSPKALRAGMGAQFSLVIHEAVDLLATIPQLEMPILSTVLSTESQSLYTLDLSQPTAWVFGSEGQGVSKAVAELATTHVSIPQQESTVESLNVAAAAAVCLYEQYRQRLLLKD